MKLFLLSLAIAAGLALAACSGDAAQPPAQDGTAAEPAPMTTATSSADPSADRSSDPSLPSVTVYKSPTCGCCSAWADHLRSNGFAVETVDVQDIDAVKQQYGIPPALQSCHTAVVDGYVVEGHVPADDVKRLLAERPDAAGLAVPGMPIGSPGMEQGDTVQPYDVILVDDGETSVFSSH